MKKYKALVVDYDNTLANNYTAEIADNVKSAVKELIREGFIFSIVTGRIYSGRIQNVCTELGLTAPQIVSGGAEIRNPQSDEVIFGKYINDNEAKKLISSFLQEKIEFVVQSGDELYTPQGKIPSYNKSSAIFKDIVNLKVKNITKIAIPAVMNNWELTDIQHIEADLKKNYKEIHVIKTRVHDSYSVEIVSGETSKHMALLEYMKLLNLQKEEVIGVGDGYNDYPLLTACGLKVAMGDAPNELREIADKVIGTEREHGILKIINELLV